MVEAAALALSTAPGDGYGRIWNSGPLAVTSAPVRASFFCGSPDDHEAGSMGSSSSVGGWRRPPRRSLPRLRSFPLSLSLRSHRSTSLLSL
ncbi:hypothetical protein E2C01_035107 [Portunus trituberculatus]|uniref:Uncharacterized protein n=1 Tax=Portunus trituberculatus TaxID=210409 RepID=A0A5B7F4P4_PORTR|nr:hypothetical protein [Portunus trituberculatus]